MKKYNRFFFFLLTVVLFVSSAAIALEGSPLSLTLQQLSAYDGKDGRPAYVAVNGDIYDVTDNPTWKEGAHFGLEAGTDVSDALNQSPHKDEVLKKLPVVGRVFVLLTLEELKAFDGLEGRPAYVAVDGDIYDMSHSRAWKNGTHNGFQAGNDLTQAIREVSPHGPVKLDNVPKVGRLLREFSLDALKAYDGLEGRPAYVAIDGYVYDLSGHPSWSDGAHFGLKAGTDATQALGQSPHGDAVLTALNIIGVVLD